MKIEKFFLQKRILKKRALKMMLFLFALLFTDFLFAQSTITGTVNDNGGKPISNVTVSVKGTTNGTTTNNDGSFTISASANDILVFSSVETENKEIKIKGTKPVNIELESKVGQLNDVVVVGYGSVRKKDLTGSVGVVNIDNAKKTASHDIAKELQGQVAGVSVHGSGEPGGFVQIKIRGISSFTNNNPLYVIDGVLVDQPYDFSPGDIESIQILKDASAAAIYGSRAATGVIIITTKKGRAGETRLSYDGYYGGQQIGKKIPVTNREQYQKITNAAALNGGVAIPVFNDPASPDYITNINTDWQHEAFKTGYIQNHSLNLSGGTQVATYSVGLGYFDQTATFKGPQDYKRYTLNANLQGKKGILSYGAKIAYTYSDKDNNTYPHTHPNVGNSITNLLLATPTMSVYDTANEGGFGGSDQVKLRAIVINPLASNSLITDYSKRSRFLGNVWAEVEPIKDLKFRSSVSYDRLDYTDFFFEPTYYLDAYYSETIAYMRQTKGNRGTHILENTLAYKWTHGKHTLDALAGTTYQEDNTNFTTAVGSGFKKPYFYTFGAATPGTYSTDSRTLVHTVSSYLGRINYNYDSRYLLTVNFRRDGSSRFSPLHRWGNFPSVAAAWNIGNEKFINLPKMVSSLKLRGGYGLIGNEGSLPDYFYQAVINGNASYVFNNVLSPGGLQTFQIDPNLKWEKKLTTNVGIDLGLFNERLTFTAEYFTNKIEDVIVAVPIPLSVGSTSSTIESNLGTAKNTGIEFTAAYQSNRSHKFTYNINGNIYTLKNKVLKLGPQSNPVYGIGSKTDIGGEVGELYGFQTEGIFQSADDIAKHATQTNAAPGDLMFKDINGRDASGKLTGKPDGTITDDDRVYLGSAIPKVYYGLNLSFGYGNFDASVFFQGSAGNKVYNGIYQSLMAGQYNNHSTDEINFWSTTNTNTNVPRPVVGDPNQNGRFSDRFVENGSYLKLQNAQIGYTIPSAVVSRSRIFKSFRVYISGQNLLTFTHYRGYDPDFFSDGLFSRGYDFGSYPNSRTVQGGVQVSF